MPPLRLSPSYPLSATLDLLSVPTRCSIAAPNDPVDALASLTNKLQVTQQYPKDSVVEVIDDSLAQQVEILGLEDFSETYSSKEGNFPEIDPVATPQEKKGDLNLSSLKSLNHKTCLIGNFGGDGTKETLVNHLPFSSFTKDDGTSNDKRQPYVPDTPFTLPKGDTHFPCTITPCKESSDNTPSYQNVFDLSKGDPLSLNPNINCEDPKSTTPIDTISPVPEVGPASHACLEK
ncbi:hypothetical protein L6452_36964 [Arctium lappa]|uniref:Uncharacterized protein n=1 Tax=Arctium lappa TaxID=4217 RepID=A0ACB8Y376_ARCLA|nr:hypothetical protein L6452_36964 [Arctium lappa]